MAAAQRYYPYGAPRQPTGDLRTDYGFTGQRRDAATTLMYYGAWYYDPALGRFVSADTLVPEAGNPQALNRYAYTLNNPVRYTDPSGHCVPGVDCPNFISDRGFPGDWSNQSEEEYVVWLHNYILWQEQEMAETGGTLRTYLGQRGAAVEMNCFLMKDPEALQDLLAQEMAEGAAFMGVQLIEAGGGILASGAGAVLGMLRKQWVQARDIINSGQTQQFESSTRCYAGFCYKAAMQTGLNMNILMPGTERAVIELLDETGMALHAVLGYVEGDNIIIVDNSDFPNQYSSIPRSGATLSQYVNQLNNAKVIGLPEITGARIMTGLGYVLR